MITFVKTTKSKSITQAGKSNKRLVRKDIYSLTVQRALKGIQCGFPLPSFGGCFVA